MDTQNTEPKKGHKKTQPKSGKTKGALAAIVAAPVDAAAGGGAAAAMAAAAATAAAAAAAAAAITVKTPRIKAYAPYDGRDTEASTSPIHHFTEELIVFYASGCNRKDRARDPTRPGPHRCQSEPPTWLGPAYRVLTFVTYVIPRTIIGLVASVLTIFVNAMIALTIVTIVMSARLSARAAAIVTFAYMAARDLCVHYLSCTFYIMNSLK